MTAAPKWFKPVVIVALLWNLLGCMAYLSDVMLKPEDIAKMTAAQQAMYNARPAWAVGATALAEGGEIFMPIAETPFATRFAMLRDRFGTSWMLLHGAQAE